MPIDVQCPCGKTLNAPDDYAGRRIKCPVCGELLTIPQQAEPDEVVEVPVPAKAEPDEPARASRAASDSRLNEASVSGRPTLSRWGITFPGLIGTARLSLERDRVVEETNGPLCRRHIELRICHVNSVEITSARFPLLLLIGLVTLPLQGFGLLILLLWIVVRTRCLAVRTASTTIALRLRGPDDLYYAFKEAVMTSASSRDR